MWGTNSVSAILTWICFWMTRSAGLTRSLGEWSRLLRLVLAVLTLWFIDSAEGNWGWEIRYICPITLAPTWSLVNVCAHKHTHPHTFSFYIEIIWSHWTQTLHYSDFFTLNQTMAACHGHCVAKEVKAWHVAHQCLNIVWSLHSVPDGAF